LHAQHGVFEAAVFAHRIGDGGADGGAGCSHADACARHGVAGIHRLVVSRARGLQPLHLLSNGLKFSLLIGEGVIRPGEIPGELLLKLRQVLGRQPRLSHLRGLVPQCACELPVLALRGPAGLDGVGEVGLVSAHHAL